MNADRSARSPHLRSSPRRRGPIHRVLSTWRDRAKFVAPRVRVPAYEGVYARLRGLCAGTTLCLVAALVQTPPARAADTIQIGSVDATSANLWPLYIAQSKGYFDAVDIKLDVVFSQSNAQVIQQLAAGSYNIAPSAGIVDPIRANEKGAPVSIIRILIQSPPYALIAKPTIKSI